MDLVVEQQRCKTTKNQKTIYGEFENKTAIATFFRSIYEKLLTLIDTREEWEKDKWDVRLLNANYGIKYNSSKSNYLINFSNIENVVFRQYFKEYIKNRLLGGGKFSGSSAILYTNAVSTFFNFISELEPNWNDLNGLTRKHIENYLEQLWYYAQNNLKQKR